MIPHTQPRIPAIIDQDIILAIYSDPSLTAGASNETWGDATRLKEVGVQVLHMALTTHFFHEKPNLTAEEIRTAVEQTLTTKVDEWLTGYNLPGSLWIPATADPTSLSTVLKRQFFETYVGAIWFSHDMGVTQKWISDLVKGEPYIKDEDEDTDMGNPLGTGSSANFQGQQNPPGYSPTPIHHPVLPSIESLITLALVHQTASQKGKTIGYQSTSSGPPHQPTFEVHCLVDGQVQGVAHGAPKMKVGKEIAARQAFLNLGWGPN